MSKVAQINLLAGTFLALLIAMSVVLGIGGTIDAVYDAGYSLGTAVRAL